MEPSLEDIVDLVLELLAQVEDRDPAELRMELEETGQELPVDSILVVEILTSVEKHYGITVPTSEEVASSTRSVYTFAAAVLKVIKETQQS